MVNKLLIDTWGWLEIYNQRGTYHQQVVQIYKNQLQANQAIYTTDYVVGETITLLFRRLPSFYANQSMQMLINLFADPRFQLIKITEARFLQTVAMRSKYRDKPKISFIDLTSMVVMQELEINTVLTQDHHFMEVGLGFVRVPQM